MPKAEQRIHHVLRFAVAMCFIGHGCFGIITKQIWCNYFAVFGIGEPMAYTLMPWVGIIDIVLGVIMLVYPMRAIALWLVFWGTLTAFLRPASGEPFAEFIERAGNFGAPLALLILSGGIASFRGLFNRIDANAPVPTNAKKNVTTCLQVIGFLLLTGHGWLNIIQKKALLGQYASIGFTNPARIAQFIGVFEITAALVVLIKPIHNVIAIFILWKILSELFYPHYELFEFIERGGSYGVLIALWLAVKQAKTYSSHNNTFKIINLF
jgi:hypothetical protein